jgi:hypothetical protein
MGLKIAPIRFLCAHNDPQLNRFAIYFANLSICRTDFFKKSRVFPQTAKREIVLQGNFSHNI